MKDELGRLKKQNQIKAEKIKEMKELEKRKRASAADSRTRTRRS